MTLRIFIILLLISTLPAGIARNPKKLIFADGIKVVFRASEGTQLVMFSELERPNLDGSPTDLDTVLANLALENEAKKYRLVPTPEEIDKQWRMLAQANRKTPKEFEDLFVTIGYTPTEGRHAFAQMNAINSLINFKVTANLIVPEADVIAYYNEHPEVEQARYNLEYTLVPYADDKTKEAQFKQLQIIAQKNDPMHILAWQGPFWIPQDDLAADKQFIAQLNKGAISAPHETENGFELFRLVDKKEEHVKSLDERYGQIVAQLRQPTYMELMANFKKNLLDQASIIYFEQPN